MSKHGPVAAAARRALLSVLVASALAQADTGPREVQTDLLIVGATESGWAAALQAARLGVESITVVHDGEWIGGQFTEQALACVDENKGVGRVGWGVDWHPMKRSFHRSGMFKELMDRIEEHNLTRYGQRMPGRPYHGPSTFRPVEAEAIFREMLQPWITRGRVKLITSHYPVRADVTVERHRPRLTGLWFAPLGSNAPDVHVRAAITIDASDWGEAIQVSGAAFECGPDPRSRYNEPSAPRRLDEFPPNEMNPITWAMIVVEAGEDAVPVPRPRNYSDQKYVRTSRLSLAAMSELNWDRPIKLGSIPHWPAAGNAAPRQLSVYTVRRLIEGTTSHQGKTLILLNYMLGQDYPLERLPQHVVDALERLEPGGSRKNIVRMTRAQRQVIFDDARQHALGVLHHLQHFVHDHAGDTTHSFRRFELSREFGTPDHLPPKPYIRESLRLKAMYMMREQDSRNRDGESKTAARERFAHIMYPDGVFAWQFHYDFHRTGRAYLRGDAAEAGPWIDFEKPGRHTRHVSDRSVFPLRSLIPANMGGLLGAQKNLGYSSIVSAAIRLHDQSIAVGQAAGATAAVSLRHEIEPAQIPWNRTRLEEVRHAICGEVRDAAPLLIWPFRDLPAEHPAFVAINRLAARGALPLEERDVDFRPDAPAEDRWRQQIVRRSRETKAGVPNTQVPRGSMSRGDFCVRWWAAIDELPDLPFPRELPDDADSDGIVDANDPSPFTAAPPVRWAIDPKPPERDGRPPAAPGEATRLINFSGTVTVDKSLTDSGKPFDESRGFGWTRDISANHRRRNALDGARDTFVFTRTRDRWEHAVANGRYRVIVCAGDSGFDQHAQRVVVEGHMVIDNVDTGSGEYCERAVIVDVSDGRLTVDIGSGIPGSNTCLNWVRITPSER